MTPPLSAGDSVGDLTREALQVLAQYGLCDRDSRRLRFYFEASNLREAVALATELRTYVPDAVHVRPALRRVLRGRPWTVAVTTPPAPLLPAVISLWERAMHDIVRERHACTFVGGRALLDLRDRRVRAKA
jgi:hypothetical protein